MVNFSENLKQVMKIQRVTQLALAANTGISQAAISRYIKGISSPGAKELYAIASALSVSMDYLWTGENNTNLYNGTEIIAPTSDAEQELSELKNSLRVVFRAMSEPETK